MDLFGGGCGARLREPEDTRILRNHGLAKDKVFAIAGAGFAGLSVARELAKLLPESDNGQILLIDEDPFLLFTPMLTEVAGGEIEARHIVHPLDDISRRIHFIHGAITGIDIESRSVSVGEKRYRADHLIVALGSVTNFHDIPGLEQVAIPMKTLGDAAAVRERTSSCLEAASREDDLTKRREFLTFVVAGGGFSGVETMAALNDSVRQGLRMYPNLSSRGSSNDPDQSRVSACLKN